MPCRLTRHTLPWLGYSAKLVQMLTYELHLLLQKSLLQKLQDISTRFTAVIKLWNSLSLKYQNTKKA